MTFLSNIPQASDKLSASQPQLLSNFSRIKTFWEINHGEINSGDEGFHKMVQFLGFETAPAQASPKSALFTVDDGSGNSKLQFEKAAGVLKELTDVTLSSVANSGTAGGNVGFFDAPWNLRFYYGTTNPISGGGFTVNFPVAYSNILTSSATGNTASSAITVNMIQGFASLTLFTSNSVSVNWLAIGRI